MEWIDRIGVNAEARAMLWDLQLICLHELNSASFILKRPESPVAPEYLMDIKYKTLFLGNLTRKNKPENILWRN